MEDSREYFRKIAMHIEKTFGVDSEDNEEEYVSVQDEIMKQRLSQIPKRYKDCTFDSFVGFERLKDYMKGGGSIVLYGSNGTGKTHLGYASLRHQIMQGIDAKYVLAPDLFDEVRESFSSHSIKRTISKYASYPYLVIDEVDKTYGSNTEFVAMYRIINRRHEEMLHTVLITNANRVGLQDVLGSSVLDRLGGDGKIIELKGDSYRAKK